ncbi:MAG: DUF421 domain-containing protein [Proteobacteria bacterium]|nr:DUF421 domain-containing protein [Pseudomonadota bacterium]
MEWFAPVDWGRIFTPGLPLLEIITRGSIVYLSIFFMLRVVLKRQAGSLGITDMLVVVLIADAAQNAMAGTYNSVPDGLVLVGTLVFWNYFLEWLAYYFPFIETCIHPQPLPLIQNGKMLRHNMRKELVSEEDLMSALRENGIENLRDVKRACMEGDGKISILEKK